MAWLGKCQGTGRPKLDKIFILLFAGNHGSARQTSAFPPQVTMQMVENFKKGGAVINQLDRLAAAELKVELLEEGRATADFGEKAAMSEEQCVRAVRLGFEAATKIECDLLCLGEMGIGNTASASALAAALSGGNGEDWVGRGTGVRGKTMRKKTEAVNAALALHRKQSLNLQDHPLEALRRLGGFEIAALVGALAARPAATLLDGFTVTAAALVLRKLGWRLEHCLAGHLSAERAHGSLLEALGMKPLLTLGMRLGEGSGATLAAILAKAALEIYNSTATFEQAGLRGGEQGP